MGLISFLYKSYNNKKMYIIFQSLIKSRLSNDVCYDNRYFFIIFLNLFCTFNVKVLIKMHLFTFEEYYADIMYMGIQMGTQVKHSENIDAGIQIDIAFTLS